MLILHVDIHVKPEYLDEFRKATLENARNSNQEPGIVQFDFVERTDDPNRFALWEVYRSEEAVAAHKLTAHYAKWTETAEKMMAEPRTRTWYKSVDAA
ncbi:MAG: antibiotic biosynthesis monooxygenase [Terriglobia bacterium]